MYAKEILEPLGMEDTAFWIPQEKQHRLTNVCPVNLLLHPAEQGLPLRWMII